MHVYVTAAMQTNSVEPPLLSLISTTLTHYPKSFEHHLKFRSFLEAKSP